MHTSPGLAITVLILAALLYFVPTVIAQRKHHPQTRAIALFNLLAGWTFIGWIAAMVWAAVLVPEATDFGPRRRPGLGGERRNRKADGEQVRPQRARPSLRLEEEDEPDE